MKVLLVNPPRENEIIANNPPIIEEERGHNPPLGLLYIAAYLEKHTSHQVEVVDSQVEGLSYAELKQIVAQKKPDVVGITAMTLTLLDVVKTVQIVKEVDEETKVVLGGPHAHIYPEETANLPGVDFVVVGEGEIAFTELVENIENVERLRKVKGLVFKLDGELVRTGLRPPIDDLDALPHPARHLTPYWKYSSLLAKRSPVTTTFTSRGCPYRCTFCDRPVLGKGFRARSASNVVDEMEQCASMGIKEFLVYDDTFTLDRRRVFEICDEIIERRLDIGWDMRSRVNTVTREVLRRLKSAHCERIHYGVEAGTEKILKILKKGITLEQVREAFKMTKEAGISTLAYFMIGSPTETRQDILQTMEFAKALEPDFVHITILTPFPSTALYNQGLREGVLERDFWQEFATHPSEGFEPRYWEKELTREELLELLDQAYRSFYLRPTYVVRSLFETRSLGEIARKAKAGLKLLWL